MVEEQASNERERCDVVILLRPERPWRPQRPSPPISFKFFIFKPRAIFGELPSGPKYWDRVFVWAVMSSVCLWQSPPGLGWRQQRETRLKKMDTEKKWKKTRHLENMAWRAHRAQAVVMRGKPQVAVCEKPSFPFFTVRVCQSVISRDLDREMDKQSPRHVVLFGDARMRTELPRRRFASSRMSLGRLSGELH